ncbi:MAG: hypothetical protein Q8M92_11180, partial [Candidatus Subteraquimicrobiales bacterium]|nr:hypothetical protein [Candidatus Subteraquimicrobiales bacterium]
VVINKTIIKKRIDLSVEWGNWSKSEKIDLSDHDGLVLHLTHFNADSFALTVITEGKIIEGPIQSATPPKEWNNTRYKRVWW